MPIKQVYGVFRDNIDEESTLLWFHVKTPDNRSAYFHVDYEKHPAFSSLIPLKDFGPSRAEMLNDEAKKLLEKSPSVLPNISELPQIEEALPALREVFDQLDMSDSILEQGVSPRDAILIVLQNSPMAEIVDERIPANERTKTAMGIILEAQRFNEKVNGLEVGKELPVRYKWRGSTESR